MSTEPSSVWTTLCHAHMMREGPGNSVFMCFPGYEKEFELPCPILSLYSVKRLTLQMKKKEPARHSTVGPMTCGRIRLDAQLAEGGTSWQAGVSRQAGTPRQAGTSRQPGASRQARASQEAGPSHAAPSPDASAQPHHRHYSHELRGGLRFLHSRWTDLVPA